ncbi:glutamate 5-kinase [Aquibacillus kalidii]|uniref:glutamate 5-kinase n=1 Tax=Aquibacillus kalidii TaxID=2762597 RepID=UPI00164821B3|nr:glutamate 5-kinase [Aquibacillus kalidii]
MAKQRIVVKIGSSSLTNKTGGLDKKLLNEHAAAIARLIKSNYEVILISSGAISAGFTDLGYPSRPVTVAGKQAAAAVGQGLLVQAYTEVFRSFEIVAAQLLITRDVFVNEEQYTNVYSTLSELLKRSVLPIINENDTVSIKELTFGDNDMLSALVSGLVNADFLVMLTDIDGLYTDNPHINPASTRYDYLPFITEDILEQTKSDSGSKFGTGGMKSKILAAKRALSLGVKVFVGSGTGPNKLLDIIDGTGEGTYIGDIEKTSPRKQKQWIAFHSSISGAIEIDDGARHAILNEGKSLLPAGISTINGNFNIGDVVEIRNNNQIVGKGQVSYSSSELKEIKGKGSQEAMLLTRHRKPEAVHRDRLVIIFEEVES